MAPHRVIPTAQEPEGMGFWFCVTEGEAVALWLWPKVTQRLVIGAGTCTPADRLQMEQLSL